MVLELYMIQFNLNYLIDSFHLVHVLFDQLPDSSGTQICAHSKGLISTLSNINKCETKPNRSNSSLNFMVSENDKKKCFNSPRRYDGSRTRIAEDFIEEKPDYRAF